MVGAPWPHRATNDAARVYWTDEIRDSLEASEIAGGREYVENNNVLTESDCDRTITTASQLINACQSSARETVWLANNVNIGSNHFAVRNITIAGDRGVNGSAGPMIFTNSTARHYRQNPYDHMRVQSGPCKFTGIRLRGPAYNNWSNPEYPGYFPVSDSSRFHNVTQWLRIQPGQHVEIENCESYGWGVQSVGVGYAGMNPLTPTTCELHHSDFHDDMVTSLGYAATVYQGFGHFHHNYFDAHRHSINGYGPAESEYLVENNVFGPNHSRHIIDMHRVDNNSSNYSTNSNSRIWRYRGGGDCTIRYNTFTTANAIHGPEITSSMGPNLPGGWDWIYSNRGFPMPGTSVDIHNNRIMQPGPQTVNPGSNGNVNNYAQWAFVQGIVTSGQPIDSNGFSRVNFWDNQYDAYNEDYDPDYGAPFNIDGETPPRTAQLRVYARNDETNAPINNADVTIDYLDE